MNALEQPFEGEQLFGEKVAALQATVKSLKSDKESLQTQLDIQCKRTQEAQEMCQVLLKDIKSLRYQIRTKHNRLKLALKSLRECNEM